MSKVQTISAYNKSQAPANREICDLLLKTIDDHLAYTERKIWHSHPVWFIEGNPIVGYSKLKDCIRLMFWSGASFKEQGLEPGTGKFKDASVRFTSVEDVNVTKVKKWLKESESIQWDYKNVQKRKGRLQRLKRT